MNTLGRLALAAFIAVVAIAAVLAVRGIIEDEGGTIAVDRTVEGDVLVSGAASLTDVLTELERRFEEEHADVDVILNLGGSATLAEQIRQGAPADVLASADDGLVLALEGDGLLDGPPAPLATNKLRIAVPAGSTVESVDDLADEDLLLGVCAEGQPCGDYARIALRRAGIDTASVIDTAEPDVRAVLAKVVAGELDAGVVYATDVLAAGDAIDGIDLDGPVARYPIALLRDAPNAGAADAFIAFATGEVGRQVLAEAGFETPP